jgi:hypothetical protein
VLEGPGVQEMVGHLGLGLSGVTYEVGTAEVLRSAS